MEGSKAGSGRFASVQHRRCQPVMGSRTGEVTANEAGSPGQGWVARAPAPLRSSKERCAAGFCAARERPAKARGAPASREDGPPTPWDQSPHPDGGACPGVSSNPCKDRHAHLAINPHPPQSWDSQINNHYSGHGVLFCSVNIFTFLRAPWGTIT